jgi:hypothetical protein
MHPVNAEHAIFVANVEHRQLMARAERERLVKVYGTATGWLAWSAALAGRVRSGLGSVRGIRIRVRGAHPVQIGDGVATTPST